MPDVHSSFRQMFDLKKFQQNVNRELKRQYPDRTRLETQCMTSLAFVKNEDDMLNCPCWVLVINIVALDMLKGKLMPGERLGRGQFERRGALSSRYSPTGSGRLGGWWYWVLVGNHMHTYIPAALCSCTQTVGGWPFHCSLLEMHDVICPSPFVTGW